MGGDGGTIAVNRRYLRAANLGASAGDSRVALEDERASQSYAMKHCRISSSPLVDNEIVCCDLGFLYLKEKVVNMLLARRTGTGTKTETETLTGSQQHSLPHVRNLSDVYPVVFSTGGVNNPTCPVTNTSLNGVQPCFVVRCDDPTTPSNGTVLSEKAIKEIGVTNLQDYGPFQVANLVKLCMTKEEVNAKRTALMEKQNEEKEENERKKREKREKKEKKKRKAEAKTISNGGEMGKVLPPSNTKKKLKSAPVDVAVVVQPRVPPKSAAYQSIFNTDSLRGENKTAGQKANDLFACSGGRRY